MSLIMWHSTSRTKSPKHSTHPASDSVPYKTLNEVLKRWRSFGRHRSRDSVQPTPRPSVSEAVWLFLKRAGASASNEPSQVAARLWDNLTHLHRDTCWLSSSQTKHQSQTGELSSRKLTAHIVFIQWIHLIILFFFLHHIAAASHMISDYNSLHHQVSVCVRNHTGCIL